MSDSATLDAAIDKGLEGVVACSTRISTIDGTTLLYRGYTIEDLAENLTFEEVVHLLWEGELPNARELEDLRERLGQTLALPSQMRMWLLGRASRQVDNRPPDPDPARDHRQVR